MVTLIVPVLGRFSQGCIASLIIHVHRVALCHIHPLPIRSLCHCITLSAHCHIRHPRNPLCILIMLPRRFPLGDNLLLQHNTINTRLEQRIHRRSLALKQAQSVESEGGRRAGEVGECVG
jgi:hypothetical protein